MQKEIIILGGIGNTERQNRDDKRVLSGGDITYTLKSHIAIEKPLVLKKVRKSPGTLAAISGE